VKSKAAPFPKRGALSLLLFFGLLFMVAAALMPPERYSPPPGIFVPENFEDYKDELLAHNVTEPYECLLGDRIIVECHARNRWELERTLEFLNSVPHSTLVAGDGYGRVQIIVFNESELYTSLPSHCEAIGRTASPKELSLEIRAKIQAQVNAYKELYSHLENPQEKEIIEDRIRTLESSLNEEFGCGYPIVDLGIIYPGTKESNLLFTAFLWSVVTIIGVAGATLAWRMKTPQFMALFLIMILFGSIFLWQYYTALERSREIKAAMDSIEALNKGNPGERNLCNMVRVRMSVEGYSDYEHLRELVSTFNMSLGVRRTGEYSADAYGSIALSHLDEFIDEVGAYGWHAFYSNHSDFCMEIIDSQEAENRVIVVHLGELPAETRKVLEDIVDRNERTIAALREDINKRAWVEFHIKGKKQRSSEDLSLLSQKLSVLGLLLGGLALFWHIRRRP
jgi:hypothetical protein